MVQVGSKAHLVTWLDDKRLMFGTTVGYDVAAIAKELKRLGLGDLALGQMRNAPSASHPWEGAQCIAHLSERAFAVLKASVGSASLKRSARCWQNHLSKTSSISDALTSEVCARVPIAAARAQLAKKRGGGGGRASALSPKRLRRS